MIMGLTGLSSSDKNDIAKIVVGELKPLIMPEEQETTVTQPEQMDTDPILSIVDQKISSIISSLPEGNIIVRGKRGCQMINQSEESLNTISDLLKNRNHYRTRSNVR